VWLLLDVEVGEHEEGRGAALGVDWFVDQVGEDLDFPELGAGDPGLAEVVSGGYLLGWVSWVLLQGR